jgi:hypothetical protein
MEEGRRLSREQIPDLEAKLRLAPDDLATRLRLLGHALRGEGLSAEGYRLLAGLIERHPRSPIAGPVCMTVSGLAPNRRIVDLWTRQLEANPDDLQIIGNAAMWMEHFGYCDPECRLRARNLFEKASRLQPQNPEWLEHLARASLAEAGYPRDLLSQNTLTPGQRADSARKAIALFEQAMRLRGEADCALYQPLGQNYLALVTEASLLAGETNRAKESAIQLLAAMGGKAGAWNDGNLIFTYNLFLGRIALQEGKPDEAAAYLVAAGKTPGSPQLKSYGPRDYTLAAGLLRTGRPEARKAVLTFLDEVTRFWANPDLATSPAYKQSAARDRQTLESWKVTIAAGAIPDSPSWRESSGSAPVPPAVPPTVAVVTSSDRQAPVPMSPANGALMDNGRSDGLDYRVWDFTWAPVNGAARYNLQVSAPGATRPGIDTMTQNTGYHMAAYGGYIAGRNQKGWIWKVRAEMAGQWGPWSEERTFDVEPVNTDPPVSQTNAPAQRPLNTAPSETHPREISPPQRSAPAPRLSIWDRSKGIAEVVPEGSEIHSFLAVLVVSADTLNAPPHNNANPPQGIFTVHECLRGHIRARKVELEWEPMSWGEQDRVPWTPGMPESWRRYHWFRPGTEAWNVQPIPGPAIGQKIIVLANRRPRPLTTDGRPGGGWLQMVDMARAMTASMRLPYFQIRAAFVWNDANRQAIEAAAEPDGPDPLVQIPLALLLLGCTPVCLVLFGAFGGRPSRAPPARWVGAIGVALFSVVLWRFLEAGSSGGNIRIDLFVTLPLLGINLAVGLASALALTRHGLFGSAPMISPSAVFGALLAGLAASFLALFTTPMKHAVLLRFLIFGVCNAAAGAIIGRKRPSSIGYAGLVMNFPFFAILLWQPVQNLARWSGWALLFAVTYAALGLGKRLSAESETVSDRCGRSEPGNEG